MASMEAHKTYIRQVMMNREDFLVIGLTGRVGAGCSETAKVFNSSFSDLNLQCIFPGVKSLTHQEQDQRTLYQYARSHWLKFDVVKVRSVITSFIMEDPTAFFTYAENSYLKEASIRAKLDQNVKEELTHVLQFDFSEVEIGDDAKDGLLKRIASGETLSELEKALSIDAQELVEVIGKLKKAYQDATDPANYQDRRKKLECCDTALETLSRLAAKEWWNRAVTLCHDDLEIVLKYISAYLLKRIPADNMDFACYVFVHDIIPAVSNSIHGCIRNISPAAFTELYQFFGNCIRRTGKILYSEEDIKTAIRGKPTDISFIPRRINHFIKSLRHPFCREHSRPTRVVIDSIKSIFEATYLRERYSAFYLYAISANENVRVTRLMDSGGKNMNMRDIQIVGWSEYADKGEEIYSRGKKNVLSLSDDEKAFYKRINPDRTGDVEGGLAPASDLIRKDAYEHKYYPFVLQNVGVSIENSDVFISNNHIEARPNMDLRWEIVRNVSLTMYPGLLLPTPIERCMQVAFIAKANSGCLSRQVGAVVTDADYNILSLGWNDVPCGDVSCARKNLIDLSLHQDQENYSNYELENPAFRNRVKMILPAGKGAYRDDLCGLTLRYCFKDLHAETRNPMRSRAMHAEEKALAIVTERCAHGYLFTTSSPCEMCSKNAKNHKIKRIYYIEAYPGISESQYTQSGSEENRAQHILFTGAIGRAYSQMYTPIMPYKDVQRLLGVNYED